MSAAQSYTTTDHNKIKQWIEKRGGQPAVVKDTEGHGKGVGLLRVDFPGYSGKQSLQDISWDEFFKTFDEKHLAFLYQDKTDNGEESRFCKFISQSH